MADLYHYFEQDLQSSATGDLRSVDGIERGQQRVIRRLMTPAGSYIWHPEYGAGLPQRIGDLLDVDAVTALIRSQIFMEAAVRKDPDPIITVKPILGGVFVRIIYVDAVTGEQNLLAFDVTQ